MSRPSWDEYFLTLVKNIASRSTCTRRSVGALIVSSENHIIASGYNGVPKGITHCTKETCLRTQLNVPSGERAEICRGLHGEQNAIIQAAVAGGLPVKGSTLYCTNMPCIICIKMIINSGIKRVVYIDGYADELSEAMAKEAGIEFVQKG